MPKVVNITGSYLHKYLTDPRYKDQWVMLSSPNTKGELKSRKLCGFLQDEELGDSVSLSTNNDALESLMSSSNAFNNKAKDMAENALNNLNKVVSDSIVYEGVDNSSRTINLIVIPGTKGNGSMKEIIDYLNKATRPERYQTSFEKLNPVKFSSYFPELNKLNSIKKQGAEAFGAIKGGVSSILGGKGGGLDKIVWSQEYMQLNIGDNVRITGLVLMDSNISWDLTRDEDGAFWYAKISLGLAPYRTPYADIVTEWFTNKDSWVFK